MNWFLLLRKKLLNQYLQFESESLRLPEIIVTVLRIQKAFLSLSYICAQKNKKYYYLFVLFARPQLEIQLNYISYIVIILNLYYLLNIIFKLPGRQYIALYGNSLRMAILNSLFDQSKDGLLAQISLIFIVIIDSLFIRGNLNIQTKNFQIIKNNILDYFSTVIHLLMMIFYDLNPFIAIIIAYINCIIIILNQYLNSPYQSKQMIIYIISIQIVTLYWGICNTFEFIDILLVPFILRIIHQFIINNSNKTVVSLDDLLYAYKDSKYTTIQIPQSNVDKIIYSSILIQQNRTFQAITILYKIQDLNFIDECKKQIIYQICLKKIDLFLHANVTAQQGITESVKQMMKSEDQNYSIYFEIKGVIQEKLKILQHISQSNVNFRKVKLFLEKLLNIQQRLEDYYHIYPCDKSQRVLGFFYGEIINDYLAAHRLFSIITLSDEKMKTNLLHSNVFSNKMVYIISNYENGLIVKRVSNNIHSLIHQQGIINQPITDLVPQGVQQWHETLVQDFFTNGYSRYLRNLGENYILQNNRITNVEFAVDVNLTDNLNFIAFLQPSMVQQMVIIIDKSYIVASESESLIQLVKVSVVGVQMQSVYSKIRDIQTNYLENVNVKFNRFTYQTSFSVRRQFIKNEFAYMIIVFDFLKKLQMATTQISLIAINEMILDEDQNDSDIYKEEKFEIPYDYDEEFLQINNLAQHHTIKVLSPKSSVREQLILHSTPRYFCKEQTERQSSGQGQKIRTYYPKQDVEIVEDQQSQVSSLAGLRNSKFFQKYDIVKKITQIDPYSKYHKLFIAFNILNILLQLIIFIIGLITLNNGLLSLASNIDLLQIKNFAFQPLESFLLTRWTILDYSNLYKANQITLEQFNSIVKFPRSNLALGYDSLSENINSLLNKKELQNILNNTYLDIYQYTDTHSDQYYNLTLRNSVNILLEYQYTLKMVYLIEGAAVIDSPYIFFSYKNYNVLKTTFSKINQETLNDSLAISKLRQITIKNSYIISILLLVFVTSLTIYYNLKIQRKYINILLCLKKCKQCNFEDELVKYHHLNENFGKNQNELFRYEFNLEQKETKFSDQFVQKSQCNFQKLEISVFKSNSLIIFVYMIIGIISSITYLQADNYLGNFPSTAIFYKALSDVGTDVPTMYAQKEVLYGRSIFPYLNQTDYDIVLNEIVQAIKRIKNFNTIQHNDLLTSNSFKEYYSEIESGNLCKFVSTSIQAKSTDLCPIVMNQNLQLGFHALLVSMVNSVEKEMAINNFTSRQTLPYLEFEGAFIVSDIIHEINSIFNKDLFEQTTKLLSVIQYYNVAMLVFMIIYLIFIYIYLRNSIKKDYHVIQKLMYIIPIKCLYCDEVFERYLRYLLVESMRD